jgi:hypothetical protein
LQRSADDMTSRLIDQYRARGEDAPLDLVRESEEWKPVVHLINGWAKKKLGPTSGYSPQNLDEASRIRSIEFPVMLREWWRLAGRHPFVTPGLLSPHAMFLRPGDRGVIARQDFLMIAVDDEQTWSGNGIHADFLSVPSPKVHGINGTIRPQDAPNLDWYKGKFIGTGLDVPALIFVTLLYHLFEPSRLVVDGTMYLDVERKGLLGGDPDEALVSKLGLKRFPSPTIVGKLYSNGEDIIYWRVRGCACRSAEAAERVYQIASARPRRVW